MERYERILVPLDGSQVAEAILPEVEVMAKAFDSTIFILRSYYANVPPGIDPTETQVATKKQAEDYVKKVTERVKGNGFSAKGYTRYESDASSAIMKHCKDHDISLIMMSTHGRGGIKNIILGSVAEKVIHQATTPILLVRATK